MKKAYTRYLDVNVGKLKKVKLGQIRDSLGDDLRPKYIRVLSNILKPLTLFNYFKKRKFNKLRKSIVENGYNPEKYGYILVETTNTHSPYMVKDGNRRIKILKELHSEDYEITVSEITTNQTTSPAQSSGGEIKSGLLQLPVMFYPSILFFLWYMLLEVLIVVAITYVVFIFVKDRGVYRGTDTHPIKKLTWLFNNSKFMYEVIMTLYYNSRNIILLIGFLCYLYYILTTHFFGLLIVVGLTLLIQKILIFSGMSKTTNVTELMKKIKNK